MTGTAKLLSIVCSLMLLAGCAAPASPSATAPGVKATGAPATISGLVFRDLDGNGVRDPRDLGEPGITVSAYDANQHLVASTVTDDSGHYVLNAELDPGKILAGKEYSVVFSGWSSLLAPGPHGPDSGTEQQFVTGGATNVNFSLFSPAQYVPPEATAAAVLTRQPGSTPTPAPNATLTPDSLYEGRGPAPDFPAGLDWLNTGRALTWADLRGKVVLLEFWTYGCIAHIRTIPRLKLLEQKYPNELVIIGVHAAKYPHEAETANIRQAILRYEMDYPVINDNKYVVAAQYGAHIWPTFVVINPEGQYLGMEAGELAYSQLDRFIGNVVASFDARGLIDRTPLALKPEAEAANKSPLRFPNAVLADEASGRLFIADSNHNRIIITDLAGRVNAVIGNGQPALQDGDYRTASFYRPQGITLAGPDVLYVADTENHAIRRVDLPAQTVTTVAGVGERVLPRADSGPARQARLNFPWDVRYADGLVYIAMAGQHQIWVYDPAREWVEPFAGSGDEKVRDGALPTAGFNQPLALATDGANLYVADSEANAVRQVSLGPTGVVNTIVGLDFNIFGDTDGIGDAVRMQRPVGIAYLDGLLYVADTYNNKIKTLNPKTREAQTWLGTGQAGLQDGAAPLFYEPSGLSLAAGKLYIADTNNHAIRVVDLATRVVSTLNLTDPEGRLDQ